MACPAANPTHTYLLSGQMKPQQARCRAAPHNPPDEGACIQAPFMVARGLQRAARPTQNTKRSAQPPGAGPGSALMHAACRRDRMQSAPSFRFRGCGSAGTEGARPQPAAAGGHAAMMAGAGGTCSLAWGPSYPPKPRPSSRAPLPALTGCTLACRRCCCSRSRKRARAAQ